MESCSYIYGGRLSITKVCGVKYTDKARDERIAGIENEVAGMKGDIAKILAAVTKN